MAELTLMDIFPIWIVPSTITISWTVQDASTSPLRRRVVVYNDNNPDSVIGSTESSASTGEFSVEVPAFSATKLTVLVVGEADENDQIFAHVTGAGA